MFPNEISETYIMALAWKWINSFSKNLISESMELDSFLYIRKEKKVFIQSIYAKMRFPLFIKRKVFINLYGYSKRKIGQYFIYKIRYEYYKKNKKSTKLLSSYDAQIFENYLEIANFKGWSLARLHNLLKKLYFYLYINKYWTNKKLSNNFLKNG